MRIILQFVIFSYIELTGSYYRDNHPNMDGVDEFSHKVAKTQRIFYKILINLSNFVYPAGPEDRTGAFCKGLIYITGIRR